MGKGTDRMKSYNYERRVFDSFRSRCSDRAKEQFEIAVNTLLRYYNTTIHENRFIVGGAVEVFTCAILRASGIDCTLYSNESKSGDILLQNDKKLSIKGTFTGGPADVKLMNKLGGGDREWDTATLFVISEVGLVFGTPNMVDFRQIKDVKDGVILKKAALEHLIEDDSNVMQLNLERKPPTVMTGLSLKASTAVAKQIMSQSELSELLQAFNS